MARKIDWMYNRKACATCKRARGHLEQVGCTVTAWEDATKVKYDEKAALGVLKGADTLIALRGTKIVEFNLKKDCPDDETLLSYLMGPTGNLRAPTARTGKTIVVGFNPEKYDELFAR